ncbi:MAG TPA: hypothetical protein DHV22_08000, partial [Xanthomarina gelatinilytica]|nr:hypothetical protein [Xanthomarina gelatinilytica]
MIYLEKEDLVTFAFERFIDESSGDTTGEGETIQQVRDRVLDDVEEKNIALISSYIGTRYDAVLIFDEDAPIRNELLLTVLVKLCVYDIIRRNAARKVPTDYKDEYDKAIELLEKIATGRLPVNGLPEAVDDEGNPITSNS